MNPLKDMVLISPNKIINKNPVIVAVIKNEVSREDMKDVLRCKDSVAEALLQRGYKPKTLYLRKDTFKSPSILIEKILKLNPLCVFNLFEGFFDDSQKEADFVFVLEESGIPFTGNSSFTLKTALDKVRTKEILNLNNILTPQGFFVKNIKDLNDKQISFPLFIKPCFEDASVGIDENALIEGNKELYEVINKKLKEFPKGLIIEEFIGGKEYSAGFLGDFPYELLGISVLDYNKHKDFLPFLTYSSKWVQESEEFRVLLPSIEERIEPSLKKKILNLAVKAAKILKCKSHFRVDLREKQKELYVIDINPNPDINEDSGFIKQAYHKGYSYPDIIEKILLTSLQ